MKRLARLFLLMGCSVAMGCSFGVPEAQDDAEIQVTVLEMESAMGSGSAGYLQVVRRGAITKVRFWLEGDIDGVMELVELRSVMERGGTAMLRMETHDGYIEEQSIHLEISRAATQFEDERFVGGFADEVEFTFETLMGNVAVQGKVTIQVSQAYQPRNC